MPLDSGFPIEQKSCEWVCLMKGRDRRWKCWIRLVLQVCVFFLDTILRPVKEYFFFPKKLFQSICSRISQWIGCSCLQDNYTPRCPSFHMWLFLLLWAKKRSHLSKKIHKALLARLCVTWILTILHVHTRLNAIYFTVQWTQMNGKRGPSPEHCDQMSGWFHRRPPFLRSD